MKAFAQRDFVQPVTQNHDQSDTSSFQFFDNLIRVWLPLTLSIFGSVWLLSLIYGCATA